MARRSKRLQSRAGAAVTAREESTRSLSRPFTTQSRPSSSDSATPPSSPPPPNSKSKSRPSAEQSTSSSSPSTKSTSASSTTHKFPSPTTNYQLNPNLYRISRGETGVLTCEPYKSHILPHWRFRTPPIATTSVSSLLSIFEEYKTADDFVGMDITRKFLQMGYTRSMRYANHKGGRKYDGDGREIERVDLDDEDGGNEKEREKKVCAGIFWNGWKKVEGDEKYRRMKEEWKGRYG